MLVRLQKHMSNIGICSRRKAEELILAKKVKVNGELVTEMGVKVDPEKDKVEVLSEKYFVSKKSAENFDNKKIYIALNKPVGYITSASSEQGESVLDLLTENNCMAKGRKLETRVYPVGRLDKDSEGLVLLTNDGDFTNLMLHPSNKIEREYLVLLDKDLREEDRIVLTKHVQLEGKNSKFNSITYLKEKNYRSMRVVTVEGRNHFVKNMFSLLGYTVKKLKRIRFGPFTVDNIPEGKYMILNRSDIEKFIKSMNKNNGRRNFGKSKQSE